MPSPYTDKLYEAQKDLNLATARMESSQQLYLSTMDAGLLMATLCGFLFILVLLTMKL